LLLLLCLFHHVSVKLEKFAFFLIAAKDGE